MVYRPDPEPESAGEPTPPRSRGGHFSSTQPLRVSIADADAQGRAFRIPQQTLDARCTQCSHRWTVAHLPMQLDKVAALCQRAACARCGNTSPVLASKGGGE